MTTRCLLATTQTWASTAAIPALLARADCRVTSLSPGPLGLSCDVSERYRCSREPSVAARELRALVATSAFDWVIVADEPLLAASYADHDVAADWLPIDPADSGAVAFAISKFAFAERARASGWNVPEFGFATTPSAAVERAQRFGLPVVLKGDRGFAGSHVRICYDAAAVRAASLELLAERPRVLVQRHVAGAAVSACVLYDRGNVAAYKAYRAECSHPDAFSASTVHAFFDHPDIASVARTFGKATNFHGMAGIDFMLASDATLYVLEVNPRPTMGFTGSRANRSFFAPRVRAMLAAEPALEPLAYDGAVAIAAYFPGHLFYIASNLAKPGARAWAHLFACLREARARDIRSTAWEISRFVYDRIVAATPSLERLRRARRPFVAHPRPTVSTKHTTGLEARNI